MSEINLLMFGCAVTFIAFGGAYIYIRERYLESDLPSRSERDQEIEKEIRTVRDAA